MNPVEQFFSPTEKPDEEPGAKVTGKRKRDPTTKKEDHDQLKKRARLFCKFPEQWKAVSKYNPKRIEEFCIEQQYMSDQLLHDSIFGFVHTILAVVCDTIGSGDGHIKTEIENDMSLRQCIEKEGVNFTQFLSNRFKIASLTMIDCINGKRREISTRPPEPVIEEINADTNREDPESVGADDNVDHPRTDATEEETQEGETEQV